MTHKHLDQPDDIEEWVTNPGFLEEVAHTILKDNPNDRDTVRRAEDAVIAELREHLDEQQVTVNDASLAVWCCSFVEQVCLEVAHAKLVASAQDA